MNLYTLVRYVFDRIESAIVYCIVYGIGHVFTLLSQFCIILFNYYVTYHVVFNTHLEEIFEKYPQLKEYANRGHYLLRCASALMSHTRIEPYANTWISTSVLLLRDTNLPHQIEYIERYMGPHMSNLIDDVLKYDSGAKLSLESDVLSATYNTQFEICKLLSQHSAEIAEISIIMKTGDNYVCKSLFYNTDKDKDKDKTSSESDDKPTKEGEKSEHIEEDGGFFYISRMLSKNNKKEAKKEAKKVSTKDPFVPVQYPLLHSTVSFLNIEYKHPSMKTRIQIVLHPDFYVIGNVLFTPLFVKRYLEYQTDEYIFDMEYSLVLVDNNIKVVELRSNNYMVLDKDKYTVCNIE